MFDEKLAAAGDRYVEITLEEMKTFLERAYHPLHPKQGRVQGEIVFDLSLSDNHAIFVRVYTSLYAGTGVGKSSGSDSIKVVLLSDKGNALAPKSKIVMRTKNWRSAVQDRVEDYLEMYEAKVDYWKERRLKSEKTKGRPREDALDEAVKESLPPLSRQEQRQLDEARAELEEEPDTDDGATGGEPSRPTAPSPGIRKVRSEPAFEGRYRTIGPNDWGIQIYTKGSPGMEGMGVTKNGERRKVRLTEFVRAYKDKFNNYAYCELWRFDYVNDRRRQEGYGGYGGYGRYANDPVVVSVVERFMDG